jgi:gamma-glutamyltranspeptidase/glutathione hydrolase
VLVVVACIATTAALVAAATAVAKEGSLFRPPATSNGGTVASASTLASEVGIAVLDDGGNAIDAAVATFFAIGVVRPELCGVGGGGFLVYRGADGETAALDFRETAPAEYTFSTGLLLGVGFGTGHNVIGVPGGVAGMDAALERYGTKPLAELIAPAARLASEGFPVTNEQSFFMQQHAPRLQLYSETAGIYLKDGLTPYEPGERLVQADYAKSLELIAEQGPSAFYDGPIADAIARAMEESGTYPGDKGTMTKADLQAYEAKWREPLQTTYRGHRVIAMPPPTSGGLALVEMLNILEGFDLRAAGQSSADHLHLVAEAQKIAWADRNEYVGDPDFVNVPVETMTSKPYAGARRQEIKLDAAGEYEPKAGEQHGGAGPSVAEVGMHTTNLAVIDRWGNAVSINCSIEQIFGSAVVAEGTGFLLNNQLTDFDPPGTANEPQPRKRPRSSMSPAIVVRDGEPVLVIGGSGGPTIIMGVVNAVIGAVDFGLDTAQAVDGERADTRGNCDGEGLQLCLEDARVLPDVLAELRNRGHDVQSRSAAGCMNAGGTTGTDQPCEYFSGTRTQAVGTDLGGGVREATADPRNEVGGVEGREQSLGALGQESVTPEQLRLRARPRMVPPGRRVRFRFTVSTLDRRRIAGATVRFAGRRVRTNANGRARIKRRFRRVGRRRATAAKLGFTRAEAFVRVR